MIKINYSLLFYILKQYEKPFLILLFTPFALTVVLLFFIIGCLIFLIKTILKILYFPFDIMIKITDANKAIKAKAKKSIKTL